MAANLPKNSSRDLLAVVLVLIAGFFLRLLLASYESEVGVDSVHYILMGDNIAKGISWDTWNTTGGRWVLPPTFPLLIAFFRMLGVSLQWSGHLASILSGTLLLYSIYLVTRQLFNEKTAFISLIIAAFYPILVDYSAVILTENLFASFVLLMLYFVLRSFTINGKSSDAFLAGLFLALAFLTKTFAIFLLPFLLTSYLLAKGGRSSNKPFQQAVLAIIAFLILALPYWIALRNYSGKWVMDGKGRGQAQRVFASDLTEEHIDPRYTGELTPDGSDFLINADPDVLTGTEVSSSHVGVYIKKYIQKLVRIYQDFPFTPTYPNNVQLFYLLPAILLGLGLFGTPGRWSERHSDRFLLYWILPFVFGIPLIFVEVRYYIPLIPILIPFMAIGVERIAEWIRERFSERTNFLSSTEIDPAVVIVVFVFIILALPKLTYNITHADDPMVSYNPRKAAAEALLEMGHEPERIMEYAHSVSFYSRAQSILIPSGGLENVINIARKYDCEFLSLDEFYLIRANRRLELEYLFDTSKPAPIELELIYSDFQHDELGHVIYRIRSDEEIEYLQSPTTW